MSAHTSRHIFRFAVSATRGTRAFSGAAPAAASSPSFTVFSPGTPTSLPTVMAAGGNTPWG
jgi:hypothetical protein